MYGVVAPRDTPLSGRTKLSKIKLPDTSIGNLVSTEFETNRARNIDSDLRLSCLNIPLRSERSFQHADDIFNRFAPNGVTCGFQAMNHRS